MALRYMVTKSETMKKLLIIALVLISCAEDIEPHFHIDPEIQPYFDQFMEDAASRGIEITVPKSFEMTLVPWEEIRNTAVCRRRNSTDDWQRIQIREEWSGFHEYMKIYIVYHELGHCFLDRPHTVDSYSIMFYTELDGISLGTTNFAKHSNRERMIDELFSMQ